MNKFDAEQLLIQVKTIVSKKDNIKEKLQDIANLLKNEVCHYDWVGFYILNPIENILTLGPFAGKPTEHKQIPVGKGVCGQVAEKKLTMIVQDVTEMDNYISCSIDVQSEMVVPIIKDGSFVAEIDIDSHSPAPFSETDKYLLEETSRKIAHLF